MALADSYIPDPVRFLRGQVGRRIDIGQGAHAVIDRPGVELAATLGSCVAVLLHDPEGRRGGMTHIHRCVERGPLGGVAVVAEIETLVNALMRRGARRADMVGRIVGGAHVLGRGRDVGASIADVCLDYIRKEGIPLAEQDIGGIRARRLLWQPTTGELCISYPGETRVADLGSAPPPRDASDVEIFRTARPPRT